MDVVNYVCPNCGNELKFDPKTGKGTCEFCLSSFTVDELDKKHSKKNDNHIDENNVEEPEYNNEWNNIDENVAMYSCPRCGAEIVAEKNTSATFCCYCHSAVVLSDKLEGKFKPSKVIPFKYDKDYAINEFLKWCSKKRFLPGEFTANKQLEKISGVYIPFWLANCNVDGQLRATAKRINTWQQGDYIYTKTDVYSVYRRAKMNFENVPNNASKKLDDKIMESIEPYDYSEMDNFKIAYLPGFYAEKYDKDKNEVFSNIENRINSSTKAILKNSITGYSIVEERGSNVYYEKTECEYALLPIWLLTYKYKNRTYIYAMNGQTGKVYGYLPISKEKLVVLFICIFILTIIIAIVGGKVL